MRHRQWGAATVGLMLGVAGLLAGRLGYLYPHLDVFAQFSTQALALTVAFAFAVFMPRFKAQVGLVLTLILLLAYGAWPHIASRNLQQPPYALLQGERELRMGHFNTYTYNLDDAAVIAEIIRLDADVISVVEATPRRKKALEQQLSTLYPYRYMCEGVTACDIAVLSKLPILSAQGQALWEGPPYIRVALGGEMTGVTVYAVHTTRFPHSRAQLRQVRALATLLESETSHIVMAGDFNATPFSRVLATIEQGAGLTRLTRLPTWPSKIQLPQLAIDHVFASAGIRPLADEQIGDNAGSDHYPVLLTLAIPPAP